MGNKSVTDGGITMKSIQTKIISLILLAMLISSMISGGIGIFRVQEAIDVESVEIMNLLCGEKAQELNSILGKIEQSTKILAEYTTDNLQDDLLLSKNMEGFHSYVSELDALGVTVASETDGAVAVYVRFCPELTDSNEGFFRVKNMDTGCFDSFPLTDLTDLTKYDWNDVETIGWYLIPIEAGEPVWIEPYDNRNTGTYMISYVMPIYKEQKLLGIVGMDINFNNMMNECDGIKIYQTGSAFLTDHAFRIVHSKNFARGTLIGSLSQELAEIKKSDIARTDALYEYTVNGVKKRVAFQELENGMYLAVTAPASEIDSTKNRLAVQIMVMSLLVIAIFLIIAREVAKSIVRPLKELNEAAKELANGNLDVSFACKSKDEVGMLSESLRETAHQLKIRIDYINNLAFVDKLTNIKNNTAYLRDVLKLNECMREEECSFSVFVVDVNGLKEINDTYGHDYGNRLIIGTAQAIVRVFGYETTYRIGGDEFAVIMSDMKGRNCSLLIQNFEKYLENHIGDMSISAAIGVATYNKEMDQNFESVFKRADGEMYKRKVQMKAERKVSYVLPKTNQ